MSMNISKLLSARGHRSPLQFCFAVGKRPVRQGGPSKQKCRASGKPGDRTIGGAFRRTREAVECDLDFRNASLVRLARAKG